jgi:hypothetical protein
METMEGDDLSHSPLFHGSQEEAEWNGKDLSDFGTRRNELKICFLPLKRYLSLRQLTNLSLQLLSLYCFKECVISNAWYTKNAQKTKIF